jgi:hypothetical protein
MGAGHSARGRGRPTMCGLLRPFMITFVRYNAIEGISHRYHHCGPICMLEVKDKCRGSSLQMAFRIFRCHRAFKTNEGLLDISFGDLKPT